MHVNLVARPVPLGGVAVLLPLPPASACQIEELEANKRALQTKVLDLRGLQDSLEKRNAELRLQDEMRMQEENDFLSFQAQSLEQFLKQVQP